MRVLLHQPQIPQNTGNVVRTCAVTGCGLTLVRPLGFEPTSRELKRAGLDYWLGVDVEIVDQLELQGEFYLFSSKAERLYTEVDYDSDCTLVFGSESDGLPQELMERYPERCVTLPMRPGKRCLNLSTAVGIALYEALRQQNFKDLEN